MDVNEHERLSNITLDIRDVKEHERLSNITLRHNGRKGT
jgi:hypothetical protein